LKQMRRLRLFGSPFEKERDNERQMCSTVFMNPTVKISEIPDEERNPVGGTPVEVVWIQQELIQDLRDEIAGLNVPEPLTGRENNEI
jgi:hypothetical protein